MPKTNFDVGTGNTQDVYQLNSSLASPLTTEGLGCLQIRESTNTFNAWYRTGYKSSVDSGKYVGVPSTHSISMRARLRRTAHSPAGSPAQFAVGMLCKQVAADIGSVAPLKDGSDNCYAVWLGDFEADGQAAPATHGVRFGKRKTSQVLTGDTLVQTHPVDSWIGVRLDVIPSGSDDLINVYVDTAGGESWGAIAYTETILAADARKQPWGGTTQLGFFFVGAQNASRTSADNNIKAFIDTYRVAVTLL